MSKFSDLEVYLVMRMNAEIEPLKERVKRLESESALTWNVMSSMEKRLGEAIERGNKFRDLLLEHFNLEIVNHPEKTTLEKKKTK